jgi:hypothetical protein
MAEITSPDYPGERLIACYNPLSGRRAGPGPVTRLSVTPENWIWI